MVRSRQETFTGIEQCEETTVGKSSGDVISGLLHISNASNYVTHENSGLKIANNSETVRDMDKIPTDHY
jgi:hypothetical protein